MSVSVRAFDVLRVSARESEPDRDRVAVEMPLEVRLNSEPFSVIMRTPGDDHHLALGFLLSESVIRGADEVERVDLDEVENVVNVWIAPGRVGEVLGQRRQVAMNSSCGMCGRRSLESLAIDVRPFAVDWHVSESVVLGLPSALAHVQSAFAETGGLHAAGLFNVTGVLDASAEDVGRHNAVDKLLGRMLSRTSSALRPFDSFRQRPVVVRDRAESLARRRPDDRCSLGPFEPGDRSRPRSGHDTAWLCSRGTVQCLCGRRSRDRTGPKPQVASPKPDLARHIPSAVDADRLPSDVAVRRQQDSRGGDFIHGAETADRNQISSGARVVGHHLCSDKCRRNRVEVMPSFARSAAYEWVRPMRPAFDAA